jgi:outer membrane murein-binding lipoprotein Lpp
MRNRLRVNHQTGAAVIGLVGALLLTGCGANDAIDGAQRAVDEAQSAVDQLSADAAAATVGQAVERTLGEAGYTITDPPSCTADLSADGVRVGLSGQVECEGQISTGAAYRATFEGDITLTGRCPGSLRIEVDGEDTIATERLDVCRIALLLEGG